VTSQRIDLGWRAPQGSEKPTSSHFL